MVDIVLNLPHAEHKVRGDQNRVPSLLLRVQLPNPNSLHIPLVSQLLRELHHPMINLLLIALILAQQIPVIVLPSLSKQLLIDSLPQEPHKDVPELGRLLNIVLILDGELDSHPLLAVRSHLEKEGNDALLAVLLHSDTAFSQNREEIGLPGLLVEGLEFDLEVPLVLLGDEGHPHLVLDELLLAAGRDVVEVAAARVSSEEVVGVFGGFVWVALIVLWCVLHCGSCSRCCLFCVVRRCVFSFFLVLIILFWGLPYLYLIDR